GDGRADLLGDLGAEVGELGDADELDAGCGPGLHARVLGLGARDGVTGHIGEGTGLLAVLRDVVGRGALAARHVRPADLLADELLVLLAGRPRDELPGVLGVVGRLLDAPGPGVEPAGAVGLVDRRGDVPD